MKIETKYNVGDRVYFIKDGQIYYSPISEIKILAYFSSPNHCQSPNTLFTKIVYVFIKWAKDRHSTYSEEKTRFELEESDVFTNTDDLISNSHIQNTEFNLRGEVK